MIQDNTLHQFSLHIVFLVVCFIILESASVISEFSHIMTEAWNTGELVNCKRTRTQTTSRSICSFAVIGRERLRVCPAQLGTRAANKSADWLITPSVLSLHRTLIWPSTVLYFSGTGKFSELRRPPAEISLLSFLRCACENSLLIGREVGTTMSIFIVKGSICQTIFFVKRGCLRDCCRSILRLS